MNSTGSVFRLRVCGIGAIGAGVVLGLGGSAFADDSAEVAELRARISRLEAQQAAGSKEVAAAIDSVLRDAERRSKLMADVGAGAGYEEGVGFYIRTGAFVLRPGAFFQFRNVTDYRENTGGGNDDETDNNFEVRRLKLELGGSAFTKDLTYYFAWNTRANDGTVFLEDAWARYMISDPWGIRAGQFKDPGASREWLNHDGRGIAVERSMLDAVISGFGGPNRTQGVAAIYGGYTKNENPLNVEVALHDGANQLNTNFQKGAWDFGVGGRAEWKVMGDWKDYLDFTAKNTKNRLFVVGVAADWSQSGDLDQITGVVDAQYETAGGIGAYAMLAVRDRDGGDSVGAVDSTDWGGLVQLSYLINGSFEIFGRWSFVEFDDEVATAGGEDTFHEITGGVNYYLGSNGRFGNKAKVTVDLNYLPNGAPMPLPGQDYAGDTGGEAEWVLRGQFQLWL